MEDRPPPLLGAVLHGRRPAPGVRPETLTAGSSPQFITIGFEGRPRERGGAPLSSATCRSAIMEMRQRPLPRGGVRRAAGVSAPPPTPAVAAWAWADLRSYSSANAPGRA